MEKKNKLQLNIKRIICLLCVVLMLAVGGCYIGTTYSKFSSSVTLTPNLNVAKWSLSLKEGDRAMSKIFSVTFKRSNNNSNVAKNKIAPGSPCLAQFILDLTDTEVAIDYNISIDASIFDAEFGVGRTTFSIVENGTTPVTLGKDRFIPLVGRNKFTNATGVYIFDMFLTWNNPADGTSDLDDTNFMLSHKNFALPMLVKVKQHTESDNQAVEDRMRISNISYVESLQQISRDTRPLNYSFSMQDAYSVNPERGFYSTSLLILNESGVVNGYTAVKSNTSKLMYLKVQLSAFSGNMNSSHTDIDLTDAAVAAFDNVLSQIKQNDCSVILRFVYDNEATGIISGKSKVEPSQTYILRHINKLSNTFKRYSNAIAMIQVGFYGLWGECYYNTDVNSAANCKVYYKQTVDALLEATADTDINIAMRTPQYYSWYKAIELNDIDSDITTSSDNSYRVGIFNDGYGGSNTDLGTYINREKETDWLKNQASHTFYGGEAVVDGNGGIGAYNTSTYFIPEAMKIHTSYLNWEWNQAVHAGWASQTYSGPDAMYAGRSALEYIENHLGYRFVIKEVRTFASATRGEVIPLEISVNNVGFGNVIKNKVAQILITHIDNNGVERIDYTHSAFEIMAKDFLSQTTIKKVVNVPLPSALTNGRYRIYLRLSNGDILNSGKYYGAIKFANDRIYNDTLQANFLAEIAVS